MDIKQLDPEARSLAAEIVTSYVGNNFLRTDDLPGLILAVYVSLTGLGETAAPKAARRPRKRVSVADSITPDYLISMEDGVRRKSLKRHLKTLGMSPSEYRTKWELPADYPMVAPSYSERRSAIAKSTGLGRRPVTSVVWPKAHQQPSS